jgi:hypothetical protein
MRLGVIRVLQNPTGETCSKLSDLSEPEWRSLSRWLDTSGLALYLLERLRSNGYESLLPTSVYARLRQNLEHNTVRMHSLMNESIAIQLEFQARRVRYTVLKGVSLWPSSVSKLELRSQLDLDFLVAEESAAAAREVLDRRGYIVHGVCGRSWEFKRNDRPGATLKDIYKDRPSWAVELHIEPAESNTGQLDRCEWRPLFGLDMPVLCGADLFLGQGLHVYKHTCDAFMRTAHLWEFRQHLHHCGNDASFLNQLMSLAEGRITSIKFGIALLLVAKVMDEPIPEPLGMWAVNSVPETAQLWIENYAYSVALAGFPGSKRYVMLQRELEPFGVSPRREAMKSVFPTRLPPPVFRAMPNEGIKARVARNWVQLKFIIHRMRFHIAAGLDLWRESHRWRKLVAHLADRA